MEADKVCVRVWVCVCVCARARVCVYVCVLRGGGIADAVTWWHFCGNDPDSDNPQSDLLAE